MSRVRLPGIVLLLASLQACGGGGSKTKAPPREPECECATHMEECYCIHCQPKESGMSGGDCPCGARGYK